MNELSLNILDIAQNSIAAGATRITIDIHEASKQNILRFSVQDNGRGMSKELCSSVIDPFVTTRTTRRVGLGLPLLHMITQQCGGKLTIASELGKGTVVEAIFLYDHIDRPPLGNVKHTVLSLLVGNPHLEIEYIHHFEECVFRINSLEITSILGDIPLNHPLVFEWLENHIETGLREIYGGGQ